MKMKFKIARILGFILLYTSLQLISISAPIRIMPLGDSITQGCCSGSTIVGGYRPRLQSLLFEQGISIDFIGTLADSPDGQPIKDKDHQGYPGANINFIRGNLSAWFNQVKNIDVILLDIGTNDFWSGSGPVEVETRLRKLLDDIAILSPKSIVLLSNLLLRTDAYSISQDQFRDEYLDQIVNDNKSMGRPVYIVDMFSALSEGDLTSDGVHPNLRGYFKMADAWAHGIIENTNSRNNAVPPRLVNGSFEVGEPVPTAEILRYDARGWTGVGAPIVVEASSWIPPTDGSRVALFNAGSDSFGGTLGQEFATVPGASYQLKFDVGIVVGSSWGPREQRLGLYLVGDGVIIDDIFSISGEGGRITREAKSYHFIANSPTTSISFRDSSADVAEGGARFSDLLLDNVLVLDAHPIALLEAEDDHYTAKIDTTLITGTHGVLGNDSYEISSKLMAKLISNPEHGVVQLEADGSFSYVPNVGYVGLDFFYYKITDGIAESKIAKVQILVRDIPAYLTNGSFEVGNLLAGAEFEQYEIAGWEVFGSPFGFSSLTNPKFKGPIGERVALFNGGSDEFGGTISQTFSTIPGENYLLRFDAGIIVGDGWGPRKQLLGILASGFGPLLGSEVSLVGGSGPASWTSAEYRLTADSITTTVTFIDKSATPGNLNAYFSDMLLDNVSFSTAPPNAAPVSVGDGYESIQDTPLVVYAPGILANDIDGDSLSLTASVVTGPLHGELLLHPDGGFKGEGGSP